MNISNFSKVNERKIRIKDNATGYDKVVILRSFKLPNGFTETFFVDEGKDSVQIFAITENKEVLIVRQFRPGTESVEIELPGGGLDSPDEDELKAAQRELLEETGYEGQLEHVASVPYSPYSTGIRHSFVATNCVKKREIDLDPNEFLTVDKITLENFRNLMRAGKVRGFDIAYIALDKLGLLNS